MAKNLKNGFFITFEGPEGSGKSVHSRRICGELLSDGYDVILTAEPGDTPLGGYIRDLLLRKEDISINERAELFLFLADRAQHVEDVIKPALKSRKIILCDRFSNATFAYQGYGLGMDLTMVKEINAIATGGLDPDLTILLDVDVATGLARAVARGVADRMEKREEQFHERVRKGYLEMAEEAPDRIYVIDSCEEIEQTYRSIKEKIYGFIQRH